MFFPPLQQTNTCEPTSVNSGTTSAASAKPNPSECVASSSLSVSSSQCDQEKLGSSSQPKDIEMRTEQKRSEDENKSNFLHTEGVTDTAKMEVAETEADNTAPTMAPPALFLHEGITPLLQELFTSVEINNQHDAIFIVLHILMSESGFSLRVSYSYSAVNMVSCHPLGDLATVIKQKRMLFKPIKCRLFG